MYRNLTYNTSTGLYDIVEGECIFSMPVEITWSLKKSGSPSIMDWYAKELTTGQRRAVNLNTYSRKESPDPVKGNRQKNTYRDETNPNG